MTRNPLTAMYYPDRMSAQEFMMLISNEDTARKFVENMANLQMKDSYPEDWADIFVKWMELNQ